MRAGRWISSLAGAGLLLLSFSCGDVSKPAANAPVDNSVHGVVSSNQSVVDYVLQAEDCWKNNDRAGALASYDKAIAGCESDKNPEQARIFAARRAAIERGGK